MSITAKSVIFDVADTYSSSSYLGLRSVEFLLAGSVVNPVLANFTAYQSSQYSGTYSAANVFNTLLTKTGSYTQGWITSTGVVTNQRCIVVFDTPLEFDEIVINNQHLNGGSTPLGAKNVVITASSDTITSTTYEDTISNATVLFDGVISEHIPLDAADDRQYYSFGTPVGITARTVIFDIADHWGSTNNLGIRSIEFLLDGESAPGSQMFTADATSEYSVTYKAENAFTDYLSKIGSYTLGWLTPNADKTDQRLIITFNADVTFDQIVINNCHSSGGSTDTGAKNVVITSSTDAITSTVYEATITNPTVLYSGELTEHPATDTVDDQTYYEYSEALVAIRAIFAQTYNLVPDDLRALFDQMYSLRGEFRAVLEQIYGLRMLAVFSQLYGDMPVYRAVLDQYYGDNPLMRRLLDHEYGDAFKYRAELDQYWNMPEALRAIFEQRYSISEAQIRALCDHGYDLLDKDLLRRVLDQLYVLAAGEALVQAGDMSVTCDGVVHTSAYNIHCEQDESLYYMVGELQLANEIEYLQYVAFESAVVITVDGEEYNFIPEYPRKSRDPGNNKFIVPLVSATVLLDLPHNKIETEGDLTGMASALVASLAASFTVHWQLVDWFIPAGVLTGAGEAPISVIKKIVAAAGGVVQTNPAGELICRPEYPVSVDKWDTATPDIELTDQDDFFQITPNPDQRPGYNMFLITDQSLSGDEGLTMEIVKESKTKNEIRVRMVPWDAGVKINMLHSGGSWVRIVDHGEVIETIEDEQIEIVAGGGRLSKPCYQFLSHDYREAELGVPDVSDNGDVTTPIDGNSLVDITYKDRYWSFMATDDEIENVQFYPEVIEL